MIVALVDCNNFYASCERVFRPELNNTPIVVLSNNDGCIVARSNEAKALGIPMGEPYFKAKKYLALNNVKVFSSNYELYGDMSNRVMAVLAEFALEIEVYSIDESFLILPKKPPEELLELSKTIRETVLRKTGIPVSVGISLTKTLAKLANSKAKKYTNGVCLLLSNKKREIVLAQTDVGDIWGIGRKSSAKLKSRNIKTAMDLIEADENQVRKIISINGVKTAQELSGRQAVDSGNIEHSKSATFSRTFSHPILNKEELREAVAYYATRVSENIRKKELIAEQLTVYINTGGYVQQKHFNSDTIRISGTSNTSAIIKECLNIFDRIYKKGVKYKKAGIILSSLKSDQHLQDDLFNIPDEKNDKLTETLDQINAMLGKDSITYLATGIKRNWDMKRNFHSPRYTTNWNELLIVN